MTIAKGVGKQVAYKKETTWGTVAGNTSGKLIRRVTSNFNLVKAKYASNETRTDYQKADSKHGVRSVDGSISGELSPGSYSDLFAGILAKNFASVTAITGLSVTIAASGGFFTIGDASATLITDGIRVGHVVRLTGAGLDPDNVGNNALVVALSETQATVKVLSDTPFVAEGPIASVTMTATGKQSYVPLTSHTDDAFTVEEYYSDITQSEVYTGNKVTSAAVKIPATGLVTCDFKFMGRDRALTGTSQYFISPTALNANGITASVQGALIVNGAVAGLITGIDFTINRDVEMANVVGTNLAADALTGSITVNGTFSSYFSDGVIRDYFDDETDISLVVAFTTSEAKAADFVSFTLPRVKVDSATKNDQDKGIIQQHSFEALLNSTTSAGLVGSTIQVVDSAA